ncbi:hypothetical protein JIN85_15735 [Luteolibacter pohnpeiensis]|uniref:DUF4468 domain-containing protein n=1 Tax=Luteolibacter pohnpeiensis TaxID=454153 RepID=A0A934SDH3_9BACT|nr:hypothetical protein [Luteolibacter pohnpeiensis]MBK1883869.1 hypothetical protein [Luteolibacter pohnpeiensis]
MKILLCSACLLLTGFSPLFAQTTTDTTDTQESSESTETSRTDGFWQATMSGGEYEVALSRITSVSRHKYLLDGALIVDEVTIDTVGQSLARFYYIEPVTEKLPGNTGAALTNRTSDLIERAGQLNPNGLENMVVKKYPETTHAHTVEYRLLSKAQLTTLFNSVRKAWENGRGSKLVVK